MVAKQVLSGEVEPGSVIQITLEQIKNVVSLKNSAQQIIESQK